MPAGIIDYDLQDVMSVVGQRLAMGLVSSSCVADTFSYSKALDETPQWPRGSLRVKILIRHPRLRHGFQCCWVIACIKFYGVGTAGGRRVN